MIGKSSLKTDLVRHILTLFTGSTIAQAIPVLVSPILTRLYPVSDFATLTVVTTLISLIGVVVTGRYEYGIGLPDNDRQARQMMWLAAFISIGVSLFSFLLLLFGRHWIADLLNNPGAADYLLLVPIVTLFYGFYQALSFWNIRKRYYKDLAAARVGQSMVNSGVSLGYAFAGWGLNGLVFGNVAGHIAAFGIVLMRLLPKNEITGAASEINKAEILGLAKKHADLPRVNGVHALTDMAQASFVIFIISGFFGALATGLYGLTMRILQAPLSMIGNSFSIVFYKEVSEKISKKQKVSKLLITTIRTLSLISFPLFAVLMIAGPTLFAFVFGEEWRDAGQYARIMSPWLFMNFIASPVSHLPLIMNRQRRFFLYSLIGNATIVLSFLTGAWVFGDITSALIIVTCTQVIFQGCMILYFKHLARIADESSGD